MRISCAAATDVCGDSTCTTEYRNLSHVSEHSGTYAYVTIVMCVALTADEQGINHSAVPHSEEPEQASLSFV